MRRKIRSTFLIVVLVVSLFSVTCMAGENFGSVEIDYDLTVDTGIFITSAEATTSGATSDYRNYALLYIRNSKGQAIETAIEYKAGYTAKASEWHSKGEVSYATSYHGVAYKDRRELIAPSYTLLKLARDKYGNKM